MTFEAPEIKASTLDGRRVSLPFPADEHAARLAATRAELQRRDLAALLVFAQESHYYLTGYDTAGYVFFQVGLSPQTTAPPCCSLVDRICSKPRLPHFMMTYGFG